MNTRLTFLFKCIVFIMVSVSGTTASWSQTTGPGGGTVNSFTLNANYIFVATNDGVFRTTIDGTSWIQKNNGLTSTLVYSLHSAAEIVFAHTSDGIFRSRTNGETWRKVGSALTTQSIGTIVSAGKNLFAGTSGGLFRSDDNGINWINVSAGLIDTFPPVDSHIVHLMVNDETIFVRGSAGFFRSDDNGESWSDAGLESGYLRAIGSDNGIIIAWTDNQIYRSTDNGVTWTVTDSVLFLKTGYHSINSINFYSDTIIAAGYETFFRSFDKGISWTIFHPDIPPFKIRTSATSGNTLFIGTFYGGVFRSSDFGSTWTSYNNNLTSSRVKFLVTDKNTVFAYTWQLDSIAGIFCTADNGLTWNEIDVNLPVTNGIEALAISGGTIFIAGNHGFFRSADTGKHWTEITGLNNAIVTNLATDKSCLFAVLKDSLSLSRSNDNGDTWEMLDGVLPYSLITDLAIEDSTVFIVQPDKGIFRSLDYGETWVRINSGLPEDALVRSIAISSKCIFTGTQKHKVFLSTDNGDHWDSAGTGLPDIDCWAITTTDSYIFIGGNRLSVWRRPLSEMVKVNTPRKLQRESQIGPDAKYVIVSQIDSKIDLRLTFQQRKSQAVSVYTLAGNKVGITVDQKGSQHYTFNTRILPTGCYLVRILAGSHTYTRKITVFH